MEFGEEADVEDLDELESQADEGGNYYTLGQEDEQGFQDFTSLVLKDDCENRSAKPAQFLCSLLHESSTFL